MIYELRTTRVRPRGVPDFERKLEERLEARQRHSPLGACWHTEIGPLLQVVELWPYEDRQQQAEVAEAVAREGLAPAVDGDLVREVTVEVLEPAPFMRPINGSARKVGPIFELRIYQVRPGEMEQFVSKWGPLLPGREKLSELLGAWTSEEGRFFHLWPYPDLAERGRVRAAAQATGAWPPPTSGHLLAQSTKIMLPASFSPLQ